MPRSLFVALVGPYVELAPLALDDVPGLLAAATEDRSTYDLTNVPSTLDEMEGAVHLLLEEQGAGQCVPLTTRDAQSAEIVGMTRFLTLRWGLGRAFPDAVEIGGTFLTARAQGTKINASAKLLMLEHAFDVWAVQRVDLKTDERNQRSRGAIERLGAKFEGILRNWQPSLAVGEDGTCRNSAMYSILPSEWPSVRGGLQERLAI